jgi:ABC-2 type transport system ATP-binding protein
MIKVSNVSKRYGDFLAVDNLNFEVRKGEVVGFLGPNGAGKTTTMKMITGFMGPTEGQIYVDGIDVFAHPVEAKKRMGYLPENPPVYGEMRIEEYLEFVANLKLVPKERIKERVETVLDQMGLQSMRRRLIQFLSKGYRQRVGIAQALISEPQVLILDEPTVGLDPKQVIEIRDLINTLKGKHTIILSTHILPEVQALCERIIVINAGKIVAQDSIQQLASRTHGLRRVRVSVRREPGKLQGELLAMEGVKSFQPKGDRGFELAFEGGDDLQERLASQIVASGCGLLAFESLSSSLEELFLELTSNGVGREVNP